MQADSYSRMVALLKVLFPLAALALLSTLFLLSRAVDPGSAIPFADKEVQDRLRDQQVTGPFFSGTTTDGDQLSFFAETLATPAGRVGTNLAEGVEAKVETSGGAQFEMQAKSAEFNVAKDRVDLKGDVLLTTSTGYRILTDLLTSEISAVSISSPGPVEATGPAGLLTAGNMNIAPGNGKNTTQLVFTNGVKLIYTPQKTEE